MMLMLRPDLVDSAYRDLPAARFSLPERMVPGYHPGTQYPQVDTAVPAMQVYKTVYQWFCSTPTASCLAEKMK